MGKLTGEVAIVTGAARGIGRALALRLADLGADVAVIDIDLHSYKQFKEEEVLLTADTTVEECQARGVRAMGIEVDCTDQKAVAAAIDKVAVELGDPTICVANCGGGGSRRRHRRSIGICIIRSLTATCTPRRTRQMPWRLI